MALQDIVHPALRAIAELSQEGRVRVCWRDGEEAVVQYDTFIPSDETDDGSEEWIVDVVQVIRSTSDSDRALGEGAPISISSNDPPSRVSSPDGLHTWSGEP